MKHKLAPGSKIVVASHNKGKVWEINQLFAPYGLAAISAADLELAEPAETESTFEGNALIKARAAAESSGLPALADDSGLEVEALDGAPGVYSADWSGPGRDFALAMQRVHDELDAAGAWKKRRSAPEARFISTLCLAWPDGKHKYFEGKVKGHLVWPPRGGNGFGYDPMFVPKGSELTFGEMEPAAKYAISHRTRAFEKFKRKCLEHLETADKGEEAGSGVTRPNSVRDAAGLAAAAANISTREELAAFVANLAADVERADAQGLDLADYLAALQATLRDAGDGGEPPWRSMAKAMLAARES